MAYDYDVIVIGGGAAGLVASKFAAGIGKRVALLEKSRLGGECTLFGCIPSKTLIRTAKVLHEMNSLTDVGLSTDAPPSVGKNGVMDRVRAIVQRIYEGHRPEVLERQGIKVTVGEPRFKDSHNIEINGAVVSASGFVICTGSSPFIPPLKGLDTVSYLTNDSLFDIKRPPGSMIILGGGPIGIEMAQAFHYLGSRVIVVEMADDILVREDKELRDLFTEHLSSQGIILRTGERAVELTARDGKIFLTVEDRGGKRTILDAETILIAVGRKANVEGLDLQAAGVEFSPKGIKTDRRLRTTAGNIYACGDVVGPYQFSHMAEYQARIAARNALLPLKAAARYDHYLWCTFTDPEFAHAGLTEEEARQRFGNTVKVYKWQYRDTDRGRTEAEEFGTGKFICDKSYRLIGAHILGARAGELIHEAQILKTFGIPLYKLDSVIHAYPTFSDVVRQPAKLAHIDKLRGNFFIKALTKVLGR